MKKWLRRLLWALGLGFGGLNVVAFLHAWRLTHFSAEAGPRTLAPAKLSPSQKLLVLLTGIRNPRPRNEAPPAFSFKTVWLPGPDGPLEAWYASPDSVPERGTVALFHGYGSSKGKLLHEAATFRELGYAVLLVDQPGSGGSAGWRTTIGYREAQAVAAAVAYLRRQLGGTSRPLVLYGVSMGAAAIMRAEAELGVRPTANILECPYGTMRQTVVSRFRVLHAPTVLLPDLLVFWGGLQNGFWGYGLRPEAYARHLAAPTLLLWGRRDLYVTPAETDTIFAHLPAPARLATFGRAGHEPYWHKYPQQWRQEVAAWLAAYAYAQ